MFFWNAILREGGGLPRPCRDGACRPDRGRRCDGAAHLFEAFSPRRIAVRAKPRPRGPDPLKAIRTTSSSSARAASLRPGGRGGRAGTGQGRALHARRCSATVPDYAAAANGTRTRRPAPSTTTAICCCPNGSSAASDGCVRTDTLEHGRGSHEAKDLLLQCSATCRRRNAAVSSSMRRRCGASRRSASIGAKALMRQSPPETAVGAGEVPERHESDQDHTSGEKMVKVTAYRIQCWTRRALSIVAT